MYIILYFKYLLHFNFFLLILGALGTSLFQPNLRIVGASAAAYALLMSHLTDIVVVKKNYLKNLFNFN